MSEIGVTVRLHASELKDDDAEHLLLMKNITALDISNTHISDFSIRQ